MIQIYWSEVDKDYFFYNGEFVFHCHNYYNPFKFEWEGHNLDNFHDLELMAEIDDNPPRTKEE